MPQLNYISLFSGGFGLDLGMELSNTPGISFHPSACIDINQAARDTIRHNRPKITIIGDRDDEFNGDINKI
jgi:site-specific DNA-cytosine methylase